MTAVTPRLEDYLEALFLLETSGSRQTVTALAENLKLTKGTIATVIKKMTEQELVLHEAYGAIRLTPEGRRIGWEVYMKHERLTSFFHDSLGQDSERSEEIACLIEHHLDGAAANRFFNMIGFLRQAQSEKKEWTNELFSSLENAVRLPMPLTLMSVHQNKGRVCRLTGAAETKHKLEQQKIVRGTVLENIRYDCNSASYVLKADGKQVSLDFATAATIWLI
ncbi:MAG: metal-dependent transcriptional regulator [Alphaproteobacteria bacterium]|nr:metal-dependent transcriptional regulator [Alphaproteobacteria bacterium]